eukprot:TRINITY_DN14890_c0_g3_i3.p1 TRINITY_DN14890_c0_g3~~TRINITY_DN14890_c0_g3_i3.p1  ORF type:complete len:712 (-),score=57.94 TRINITY_DN14890_c0_g3_i3:29-2164(-)
MFAGLSRFSRQANFGQYTQLALRRRFSLPQEEPLSTPDSNLRRERNTRKPRQPTAIDITFEIKDATTAHDLWRVVQKHRKQLDLQHVVAALHILARLTTDKQIAKDEKLEGSQPQNNHWFDKVVNLCCNKLRNKICDLDSKGAGFAFWSFGRLGVQLENAILVELKTQIIAKIEEMDAMSVTQVLVGMASFYENQKSYDYVSDYFPLLQGNENVPGVLEQHEKINQKSNVQVNNQPLGEVRKNRSKNFSNSHSLESNRLAPIDIQIIESITHRLTAKKMIHQFDVRGAANCAWALATLNWKQNPELFIEFQKFACQHDKFQPQELVNFTWACAKSLRQLDQQFLQVMTDRAKHVMLDRFSCQHLSNFLWACATNKFRDFEFLEMFDQKASEVAEYFSPIQASIILSSFKNLNFSSKKFVPEFCFRYDVSLLQRERKQLIVYLVWGLVNNFKLMDTSITNAILNSKTGILFMKNLTRLLPYQLDQTDLLVKSFWSISKVPMIQNYNKKQITEWTQQLVQRKQDLSAREIIRVLNCFQQINLKNLETYNQLISELEQRLRNNLQGELQGNLATSLRPQDLSQLCRLIANLRKSDQGKLLLEFVIDNVPLDIFKQFKYLVEVMWAMANQGIFDRQKWWKDAVFKLNQLYNSHKMKSSVDGLPQQQMGMVVDICEQLQRQDVQVDDNQQQVNIWHLIDKQLLEDVKNVTDKNKAV